MNVEVIKRIFPCAWYKNTTKQCRSCSFLHHVRLEGTSRTLCGHECILDWMPIYDGQELAHPEYVDMDERCSVCYSRLPEKKPVYA